MNYFIEIEGLKELESKEKWDEAKELLYDLWSENKDNIGLTIRLIAECWYVLAEWEFVDNKKLCYESFSRTLQEVNTYGLENFKENHKFSTIVGYMISTLPFLFGKDEVYESIGKGMLERVYINNPEDLLGKIFYLGTTNNIEKYRQAVKEAENKSNLGELFTGDTAIENYFKEVVSNYNDGIENKTPESSTPRWGRTAPGSSLRAASPPFGPTSGSSSRRRSIP